MKAAFARLLLAIARWRANRPVKWETVAWNPRDYADKLVRKKLRISIAVNQFASMVYSAYMHVPPECRETYLKVAKKQVEEYEQKMFEQTFGSKE